MDLFHLYPSNTVPPAATTLIGLEVLKVVVVVVLVLVPPTHSWEEIILQPALLVYKVTDESKIRELCSMR